MFVIFLVVTSGIGVRRYQHKHKQIIWHRAFRIWSIDSIADGGIADVMLWSRDSRPTTSMSQSGFAVMGQSGSTFRCAGEVAVLVRVP